MKNSKLLDIDFLKKNNKRLYNFGIGFIQLVLNNKERVHFYLKDSDFKTNDEIHNHRYNFNSTIIKGSLTNKIYDIKEVEESVCTHYLMNESCNKEIEVLNNVKIPVIVDLINEETINNGSYFMLFNKFHTVEWQQNTITYLNRSSYIVDYAQVLYLKNKEKHCPFSDRKEEHKLWETIEYIINN